MMKLQGYIKQSPLENKGDLSKSMVEIIRIRKIIKKIILSIIYAQKN